MQEQKLNPVIKVLKPEQILLIMPIMLEYTEHKISHSLLEERFLDMASQNYECVVIYLEGKIIGLSGLWFMTRHYAGKSVEPDHVYISPQYRSNGLGKILFNWIHDYVVKKGCTTSELNTYVENYPSHKFYYNHGYEILGYHFVKKL